MKQTKQNKHLKTKNKQRKQNIQFQSKKNNNKKPWGNIQQKGHTVK